MRTTGDVCERFLSSVVSEESDIQVQISTNYSFHESVFVIRFIHKQHSATLARKMFVQRSCRCTLR